MRVAIIVPVFNDWGSFEILVEKVDHALAEIGAIATFVAVNDGSLDLPEPGAWSGRTLARVEAIEVLDLVCNLGHQKAIAVGLAHVSRQTGLDAVVIMDSDGEDDPADIPRLLAKLEAGRAPIVLAHRGKRSEHLTFRALYTCYKLAFRWLTGAVLSFGNFCALTPQAAKRLAFMSNLWNSLPATCLRSKLPYRLVSTVRGRRYQGQSQMNFVGLVLHGLQAITVFSDAVIVRLALALAAASGLAVAAVLGIRFFTDWVPPGWASNMIAFIGVGLWLTLFGLVSTSLLALQERSNMNMVPFVHGPMFVDRVWRLKG